MSTEIETHTIAEKEDSMGSEPGDYHCRHHYPVHSSSPTSTLTAHPTFFLYSNNSEDKECNESKPLGIDNRHDPRNIYLQIVISHI
jgi:hypothetical protein